MKPILDWSAYHESGMGDAYADIPKTGDDFARAVAVCINSRQCENKGKGVMCPSFRVTDEAELSTGGRVRMLKAALNGELALDDPLLFETMDLCVACKGCKRECENNVDMAQIKTEYLAQLGKQQSLPLRTRLFASLPRLLHQYPSLKFWITRRNRMPRLAKLAEILLDITADKALPEPAAIPFTPQSSKLTAIAGEVVLLIDTFARHFEPEIAEAALAVLEHAGYQVHLAEAAGVERKDSSRPLCCGRTFIAHGMVDESKREAQRVVEALLPFAERGVSIVGLEPACLLAIRDDYRALGLGDDAAKVSDRAILFEEFVVRETAAGRMQLSLSSSEAMPEVLVHGHCHQKAVGAMKSMRKVMKMIPGLKFELIESSCCGMAGSFGLEYEHTPTSRAMAEAALLPALRQKPEAMVLANGFSCREQIRTEAGRKPVHLAMLLRQALVPKS